MKTNHYVILAMMLSAIALQLSGISTWAEAIKPQFISGLLLSIASMLTAMFSDKPGAAKTAAIVRRYRGQ